MIKREPDGLWILLEETIAAHHDEVFTLLTTAGGLTRWFPVAAEVDLRPGGRLVLSWNKDFSRTTTVAILDYDPGGVIVWDWQAAHSEQHAPVYWTVRPDVEEGCRVELRQGPFTENVDSLITMAEEAASWRWQLCNLRSVLESSHDMRKVRPM